MLLKFTIANTDGKAIWINPDHVTGVLASSHDVATVYLVGGVEHRLAGTPEEIARQIDVAAASQIGGDAPGRR